MALKCVKEKRCLQFEAQLLVMQGRFSGTSRKKNNRLRGFFKKKIIKSLKSSKSLEKEVKGARCVVFLYSRQVWNQAAWRCRPWHQSRACRHVTHAHKHAHTHPHTHTRTHTAFDIISARRIIYMQNPPETPIPLVNMSCGCWWQVSDMVEEPWAGSTGRRVAFREEISPWPTDLSPRLGGWRAGIES